MGVVHTLSQISQEYWIPQSRAEVRKVISKGVICKRHGGSLFQLPNMSVWPKERMSQSAVFQYNYRIGSRPHLCEGGRNNGKDVGVFVYLQEC